MVAEWIWVQASRAEWFVMRRGVVGVGVNAAKGFGRSEGIVEPGSARKKAVEGT
jgi:hypothetical protein